MNRPIRRVSIVMCLFFAILLANLTYSSLFRHQMYVSSPYNRRILNEEFSHNRGLIMVGNTAIADTQASNDALKYQRVYPNGPLWAPVTGAFTYAYGETELERYYNSELAGTSDNLALNQFLDAFTDTTPTGATLETTLNAKAQQAAYDALSKLDAKGAVVALNPQTGAVLALVSTPSYDPNTIATHDTTAAQQAEEALTADANQPTDNRAVREIYPPGSTFKVIVTAAALESGMTEDTLIDTPASLTLPGTTSVLTNQDATDCGNGKQTLLKAFRYSCNTAFANLGMTLGEDKLAAEAKKFGFGETHLAELYGAASQFPTGLTQAELAQSSIGQFDVAASPLQMAMAAAAVANNGKLMDPYIVSTVRAPDLSVLSTHQSKQLSQVMSESNAKVLQQIMIDEVDNGSGSAAKISGVEIGGKTGTAQTTDGVAPYGWFVAFGPGSNPTWALAVCITDSNASDYDKEYAGASIAAPVAKAVEEALLS